MEEKIDDKAFLEYIVKSLVDHQDEVEISREVDEMGVLLSLKCHPEDMGQLIGRKGSTAKAIRTLVRIVGLRNHARINLKIEEPEGGKRIVAAEAMDVPTAPTAPVITEEPKGSLDDLKI